VVRFTNPVALGTVSDGHVELGLVFLGSMVAQCYGNWKLGSGVGGFQLFASLGNRLTVLCISCTSHGTGWCGQFKTNVVSLPTGILLLLPTLAPVTPF